MPRDVYNKDNQYGGYSMGTLILTADDTFFNMLEEEIRTILPEQTLLRAASCSDAQALMHTVQTILIDGRTPMDGIDALLANGAEVYEQTWFVVIGGNAQCNDNVMQLQLPIDRDSLSFFLTKPRFTREELHMQALAWRQAPRLELLPAVMEHLFSGILNAWVLSDRSMIIMAAYNMQYPELVHMTILPVLVKTIHQSKVTSSKFQSADDHRWFIHMFSTYVLPAPDAGLMIDRFNHKWAILLYADRESVTPDLLRQRCIDAAREAKRSGWLLSFYIGDVVAPEQLRDNWIKLESLAEQDVGYPERVIKLGEELWHDLAEIPDMAVWQFKMDEGKYEETLKLIRQYITSLAQSEALDERWMQGFRDRFLQILYHSIQIQGIPVSKVFVSQRGEAFQHPTASVPLLLGWIEDILNCCIAFQKNEQADTVVKRAQKYILQHLNMELNRDTIAVQVYVSGGYLGRIFKKELHMTIAEYVFAERMRLAANMLEQTDLSIMAISLNVGYSNFPYFSTLFKKYSGESPKEYRKHFRTVRKL